MSAAFKPTDLRAPGAIDNLLAFHKARFGDARMEDGEDGAGGEGAGEGAGSGLSKGAGATSSNDKGFPENTPLAEMSVDQREAYWKFQARKHEERSKAFDGLTPEALKALQDKASKHDELERELMSDKDKAAAEARDAALAEADARYQPALVQAKFEALSAGRIDADRLEGLLEDLDLTKYLTNGKVDADKVAKKVDVWAPPEEQQQGRRGPTPTGAGNRSSSSAPSLSTGSEAYARRHGKKSA